MLMLVMLFSRVFPARVVAEEAAANRRKHRDKKSHHQPDQQIQVLLCKTAILILTLIHLIKGLTSVLVRLRRKRRKAGRIAGKLFTLRGAIYTIIRIVGARKILRLARRWGKIAEGTGLATGLSHFGAVGSRRAAVQDRRLRGRRIVAFRSPRTKIVIEVQTLRTRHCITTATVTIISRPHQESETFMGTIYPLTIR
jgi:hypothetical protein